MRSPLSLSFGLSVFLSLCLSLYPLSHGRMFFVMVKSDNIP